MNVGVFVGGFQPDAGGGFTFEQEILSALLQNASASEHKFTLILPTHADDRLKGAAAECSARIVISKPPGRMGRWREALWRESAFVRARWPRVSRLDAIGRRNDLHVIWFLGAGSYYLNTPYITTVWDLQHRATPWFPEMSDRGVWDARESANRWFLQRAARIITGTRTGKSELQLFYGIPEANISILPHPTPEFALRAANHDPRSSLERHGLAPGFLFYPAQFWPHKNHVLLVKALQVLKMEYGLTIPAVFAGSDKGNMVYVEELAKRLGLASLVRFLGFISEIELIDFYRSATALAYVSECGPENLPPLEAFALGCPVVAADVPGAREQLGDAAILFPPNDPQALAASIASLYSDSVLRANLIKKGRARAVKWTGSHFVQGVFRILDEFSLVRALWR